jgi:hypothetical protein
LLDDSLKTRPFAAENPRPPGKKFVCEARFGISFAMPKQTEPLTPIRLSDNTIIDGKFYVMGDPLPFARVEDLPPSLQPLVVTDEPEEFDDEPRGAFELNAVYRVTDDNRLGRQVQRQIAQLEALAEEKEWIEEEADAPLPPEVAESLQASHQDAVAQQAAQAGADAERADQIADAVIATQEPPQLFVKRGGRHYAPALKARLKPGEDVFTREPDGSFQCIGITESKGELPDLPIIL